MHSCIIYSILPCLGCINYNINHPSEGVKEKIRPLVSGEKGCPQRPRVVKDDGRQGGKEEAEVTSSRLSRPETLEGDLQRGAVQDHA